MPNAFLHIVFLSAIQQTQGWPFKDTARSSASSLQGRTPCCADRLSTLTCARLARKHPHRFHAQCSASADFAFVQCCGSCFDRRFTNSSGKYKDAVKRLIDEPDSGDCFDVRGKEWCNKFSRKPPPRKRVRDFEPILPTTKNLRSFWEPWFRQGCEAFPFAFRVCRQSCGFCTTGSKRTNLLYDYDIAMDRERCPPTHAFSIKGEDDFDPLASLDIEAMRAITGDYFVVLEHGYEEDLEREAAREKEKRKRKIEAAIRSHQEEQRRKQQEARRVAQGGNVELEEEDDEAE